MRKFKQSKTLSSHYRFVANNLAFYCLHSAVVFSAGWRPQIHPRWVVNHFGGVAIRYLMCTAALHLLYSGFRWGRWWAATMGCGGKKVDNHSHSESGRHTVLTTTLCYFHHVNVFLLRSLRPDRWSLLKTFHRGFWALIRVFALTTPLRRE